MPKIVSCTSNPVSVKIGSVVITLGPWSSRDISDSDLELSYKSVSKMVSRGVLRIVKDKPETSEKTETVDKPTETNVKDSVKDSFSRKSDKASSAKVESAKVEKVKEEVGEEEAVEEIVVEIPDISYLSNMSKKDLVEICNKLGLDADMSLKKSKIVKMISQYALSGEGEEK